MILYGMFIVAVFCLVGVIVCGALGAWMRDEHPPVWIPPEPRHVGTPKPGAYDWQRDDEEWLAKFLEEADDARRPPD